MIRLIHGDCLEKMKDIPDGSIDLILTDPPYGTTACKWDSIIPLEPMWEQLKRIIKDNGAMIMTASQPFTTILISSNMKMFKYCWVWNKICGSNFLNLKNRPFKTHEDVVVFFGNANITFNAIRIKRTEESLKRHKKGIEVEIKCTPAYVETYGIERTYGGLKKDGLKHPIDILTFNIKEIGSVLKYKHPTKKPVKLMQYLIKTYTNKGDTVLDFTMGSGTTGVACKLLKRNFIGIELDPDYFKIAEKRITSINAIQDEIDWGE